MKKYWAENKQIRRWSFLIIKTLVLGSFGLLICANINENMTGFIAILRNPSWLMSSCMGDCNFPWVLGLFGLLCAYEIGLLICLVKAPKGFWLNFLLVFWGLIGLLFLMDAWQYSWQPKEYTWTFAEGISYSGYIGRNLLFWMWCAIGVLQVYLPSRVRKYVISSHLGILLLIGLIGGILTLIYGGI